MISKINQNFRCICTAKENIKETQ